MSYLAIYAENVDKKSDTENMKLALTTYNAFKEIAANYAEKGAENKSYEKYYTRLTKDRTKELKEELKKRLKELNMPDQVL